MYDHFSISAEKHYKRNAREKSFGTRSKIFRNCAFWKTVRTVCSDLVIAGGIRNHTVDTVRSIPAVLCVSMAQIDGYRTPSRECDR